MKPRERGKQPFGQHQVAKHRQSQPPIKATASTVAVSFAATLNDQGEPIKPTFSTPLRPMLQPAADKSDVSECTTRFSSDLISRDSMAGVVWNDPGAGLQEILYTQQRRQAKQKLQQMQAQGAAGDALAANRDTATAPRQSEGRPVAASDDSGRHVGDRTPAFAGQDVSELLQLLIGHVFGTDCQKLHRQHRLEEESPSMSGLGAGRESDMLDAAAAAALSVAADRSEMMTLTCGDLSKTLMTQLESVLHDSRRRSTVEAEPPATAAIPSAPATPAAATTPAALPATPATEQSRRSYRGSRRTHDCSNLTLNGSEEATTKTTSIADDRSSIPRSDTALKSVPCSESYCNCSCNCSCGANSCGSGRKLLLPKVVVDVSANQRVETRNTDAKRRGHRARSRCGNLHTPEVCKRMVTTRTGPSSCWDATATATTQTAAVVEWEESIHLGHPDRRSTHTSEDGGGRFRAHRSGNSRGGSSRSSRVTYMESRSDKGRPKQASHPWRKRDKQQRQEKHIKLQKQPQKPEKRDKQKPEKRDKQKPEKRDNMEKPKQEKLQKQRKLRSSRKRSREL